MGTSRAEHKNETAKEVFRDIISQYDPTDINKLKKIKRAFTERLNMGHPERGAVALLQAHPELYPQEYINYFAAVGLRLFSTNFIKEEE